MCVKCVTNVSCFCQVFVKCLSCVSSVCLICEACDKCVNCMSRVYELVPSVAGVSSACPVCVKLL